MENTIKNLENKKMVHKYLNLFIDPSASAIDEEKIKINTQEDYLIASYNSICKLPFNEEISLLMVLTSNRALIEYKKAISIEDNYETILEAEEYHVGGFELNKDKVDMTDVITTKRKSSILNDEDEKIVKKEFKFSNGEKDLLNNPYNLDEISYRIKRR